MSTDTPGGGGRTGDGGRSGGSRRGKSGRGGGRGGGGGRGSHQSNNNPTKKSSKERSNRRNNRGGNKPKKKNNEETKAPLLTEEELKLRAQAEEAAKEAAALLEKKRLEEEEAKQKEADEQLHQQQQAELEQQVKEAIQALSIMVQTTQEHKESRQLCTSESLVKARKDFFHHKKKYKSDLKKCSGIVKKIKSGVAWSLQPEELVKEVESLNLTRYVEEVASALMETKFLVKDLPVVVALCRAMHVRYADFIPTLLVSLWSTIHKKSAEQKVRRLYVRLLAEFCLNGIILHNDTKQLQKTIAEATGGANGTYAVTDANLVVSFVKAAGFEILGSRPRSIQQQVDLLQREIAKTRVMEEEEGEPKDEKALVISASLAENAAALLPQVETALEERAVPPATVEVFHTHCVGAYETLSKSLVETHLKLQKLEKRCAEDRLVSGSLSEAREKGLADARKLLESLQKSVEALSDVLVLTVPELEQEEEETTASTNVGVELWKSGGEDGQDDFGPFDDEETRSFYCDIPDLLTTIPSALLGMSQEEIERRKAENFEKYGAGFDLTQELESDESQDVAPSSEADLEADEAAEEESKEEEEMDVSGEENKDTPHYRLTVLLEQELPECNRREQVDEIAEKFIVNHGTSKNSRKRLSKTLFLVPRTRLDLLPYYSRLAAVIDHVFQDVAPPLVQEVEQQFHGQAKYKKNQNVESRLKTARYLGELTKFRVAPPIIVLRALRRCLDDFSGYNIDVACCILESCGRYLYRVPHTTSRLTALMDTMMRISKAKNLDDRAKALINSAFFMVKPPPTVPRKLAKVYPPLEAYSRHLLLVRLVPEESSIAFVTKQLNRYPWDDPSEQCGALICKYMMKACRKGRYKAITAVARVTAKLRRSRPEVAVRLVDALLGDLRWSLEHPDFREQQRSITYAKLLGELYCAGVASVEVVIQQLYQIVNLGHEIPDALRQASEVFETDNATTEIKARTDLPVFNSARGISQTIQEEEEMDSLPVETAAEVEPQQQVVAVSRHSIYDPRVPTPSDPPNSVLRIQLVCTLLDSAAKSLVSRNNLALVEAFLASFQRYIFTKSTLPTEVEFALLDTFDIVDSRWKSAARELGKGKAGRQQIESDLGFPRYRSWLEAHNATVAFEEVDAHMRAKTKARLKSLAGVSQTGEDVDSTAGDSIDVDDLDPTGLGMEEEDEDLEDQLSVSVADSLSVEESEADEDIELGDNEGESQVDEISDEETSDESNGSDEDSKEDDVSEEELDEEAYMRQLEEEAFGRELRRVTMEALEKGKSTARGGKVADYMPSGSQFVRKRHALSTTATESAPTALGGKEGVTFQLLKKGNKGKVESKELVVPSDTNLAKLATRQDDEAARERDLLKARVLQYEADSAEQQLSGGNVYLEQSKLQVIRNRPLSMEQIDRNFGSTRGETPGSVNRRPGAVEGKPRSQKSGAGRFHSSPGRGRAGRGRSGRSLYF